MILAFRGTEGLFRKPADWLTNLDLTLVTADWLPPLKDGPPMVHRGFLRAYESIRPGLVTAFTEIEPSHVYVIGHSLGGALAILAALDIKMQFPGTHVAMYNFGSPRVGDPLFAHIYDELVRNSYRVVHDGDRSPEQPREGYQHVGQLHILDHHPNSKYPHHKCEYYLEQLDKEISQTGGDSAA
jgi:predicted lipase